MKHAFNITLLLAAFMLAAPIGCDKLSSDSDKSSEQEKSEKSDQDSEKSASDKNQAKEGQTDETKEASNTTEDAPFITKSTVELIEQGEKPRQKLRYKLEDIKPATMRFTMQTTSKVTAGDQPPREVSLPKMTVDMAMTNPKMLDNGNLSIDFELLGIEYKAGGDDQRSQLMARMMEQQLGQFEYSGTYVMNARGQIVDGSIDTGNASPQVAQMSKNIEQSLQQLTTAFPKKPVGVGATWKVDQDYSETLPFDLEQNVLFEVKELDGNHVKLATTIDQSADPQKIEDDSMPKGSQLTLEKFTTKGSGVMEFSLDSLTPEGNLDVNMNMAMKGNMPQKGEQSMETDMTMTMTMEQAPEGIVEHWEKKKKELKKQQQARAQKQKAMLEKIKKQQQQKQAGDKSKNQKSATP